MNNKKLSSVEDLIAVMKERDLGSLLSFEVKRPKKPNIIGNPSLLKKTQEKAKVADKEAQNNLRLINTQHMDKVSAEVSSVSMRLSCPAGMNILPSRKN